jgi:hypothetical protein
MYSYLVLCMHVYAMVPGQVYEYTPKSCKGGERVFDGLKWRLSVKGEHRG